MTRWNVRALAGSMAVAGVAVTVGACGGEAGGSLLGTTGKTTAQEAFAGPEDVAPEIPGVVWGEHVHMMPTRTASTEQVEPLASSKDVKYYGGPVISNVKIVEVLYGSGTYIPQISPGTSSPTLANFYAEASGGSTYVSALSEYSTSSQTIGAGSYSERVQISPAAARDGATITDKQIQTELNAQITAGKLPAPDANTLYMVSFPKGKSIKMGTSKSCVQFCAYHGTFQRNGQDVYYGVLPDMSAGSGCAGGCGSGSTFNNQTSVASHEVAEAITDAAVGLATTVGAPLAWYNTSLGEVGDICNGQDKTFTGSDGRTYTAQKIWSNAAGACR